MLLTQEPTFVIHMVVTQEPTIRKIAATHAFQIMEWFTVTYHRHVKPSYKAKSFKENQCIVARGHATNQVGENVESQKYHILFIFHIPFVTFIPILSSHKTINSHHFNNTYGFILPFYIFIISFTINQHVFPKLCFVTHWIKNIAIYIGMIHNMKKMLSNVH